jgi:hypothetical protein
MVDADKENKYGFSWKFFPSHRRPQDLEKCRPHSMMSTSLFRGESKDQN